MSLRLFDAFWFFGQQTGSRELISILVPLVGDQWALSALSMYRCRCSVVFSYWLYCVKSKTCFNLRCLCSLSTEYGSSQVIGIEFSRVRISLRGSENGRKSRLFGIPPSCDIMMHEALNAFSRPVGEFLSCLVSQQTVRFLHPDSRRLSLRRFSCCLPFYQGVQLSSSKTSSDSCCSFVTTFRLPRNHGPPKDMATW